jgi:hypothetical protein
MDLAGAAGKFRDTAYEAAGGETGPEVDKVNFYTELDFKGKRVAYRRSVGVTKISIAARSADNLTEGSVIVYEEPDGVGRCQVIPKYQRISDIKSDDDNTPFEAQSFHT